MYPVTNSMLAAFVTEQRQTLRITGTDKNSNAISITEANVMMGGFEIDRYSCNGEKLEIGTAIASELTLKLDNRNGQFNSITFEGAELFVEIGIARNSTSSTEWLPCGYFTCYEQPRSLSTITLHALDRMAKFDKTSTAANMGLTFPATVEGLVNQVCTVFGITIAGGVSALDNLPNATLSITELPTIQTQVTYRNIIQWCAGIMGTNAWMDWNGNLRFTWYDATTSYRMTAATRFSSDLYESDLTVTGVKYTNSAGIDVISGTDDYALDLTGNYLAEPYLAQVMPNILTVVDGFSYRPFQAEVVSAPYLWPMDAVTFVDKDGNDHSTVLTNVNFTINGTMALESKGLTAQLNSDASYSGLTPEQAYLINKVSESVTELDENLTQQEIFNRLTNNGQVQGLYLKDGKVYINATYIDTGTLVATLIKGGTLTMGGANNVDGLIQMLDKDGNVACIINNIGVSAKGGSLIAYSSDEKKRAIMTSGQIGMQYFGVSAATQGREEWFDIASMNLDVTEDEGEVVSSEFLINCSDTFELSAINSVSIGNAYGGVLPQPKKRGGLVIDDTGVAIEHGACDGEIRIDADGITLYVPDNTLTGVYSSMNIDADEYITLYGYLGVKINKLLLDNALSVANGGTGASDKAGACENLEYVNSKIWSSRRFTSGSVNDAPLGFAAYAGQNSDVTDKPYSSWFDVQTIKSLEGSYARQVAFPWGNANSIAFRVQNNGTWSAWRYIATQATAP